MKTKFPFILIICFALSFSVARAQTELVTNGNFETGTLAGWTMTTGGGGALGWSINNGTIVPTGGSAVVPPISGAFDVVSQQFGSGINLLTQPITLPANICNITLSWKDRLYNWSSAFVDPQQEFRVSILHGTDPPIVVYSTNPGDPLIQPGPNSRSFDLTSVLKPLEGQVIQIQFTEQDTYLWFNVFLDDVSLLANVDTEPPTLIPTILTSSTTFTSGGWTSDFTGINVNNTGNTYAFVAPGAPVNLKFNWNMYYTGSYCPGCITQHYVTLQASAFNACNESWSGGNGNKNYNFTAPTSPGLYYISLASSWWFSCNQFFTMYGPNTADNSLGYIIVGTNTVCPVDIVKNTDNNMCSATISKGIDVVPFDNCAVQSLTYTLSGDTPGSGTGSLSTYTFNKGVTTVNYLVTDINSNTYSCSFTVTVNDKQPPTISCLDLPATVSTGSDNCEITLAELEEPSATDNCDPDVAISASPVGPFGLGEHTVTWTATDDAGNYASCSKTFTVVDDIDPVITCPTVEASYLVDIDNCYATLSFAATAEDNCGVSGIKYYVGTDEISFPYHFPLGTTTVKAVATDLHTNTDDCTFNVNTILRPTRLVYTGTPMVEYSDKALLRAKLTDVTLGIPLAGKTVHFQVGTQFIDAVTDAAGVASVGLHIIQAPGPYSVIVSYDEDCPFAATSVTRPFMIAWEKACAVYSGVMMASTGSVNSSLATVVLAATVTDDSDGYPGDIRNALVQFWDGMTPISPLIPVGLVDPNDTTYGTAVYEWKKDIGSQQSYAATISARITGFYRNRLFSNCFGTTEVSIYKPGTEFITGGGYLVLEQPNGTVQADIGSKNNFGFNIKYNKKGTNLQGNINTIVRKTILNGETGEPELHEYQVKGNALSALAVSGSAATFTGKANLQDVSDPENPIGIAGNFVLKVTMTDNGEPGTSDKISITAFDKAGGIWFTSRWEYKKPTEQLLAGGNLKVSATKAVEIVQPEAITSTPFELEVYPNPSSGPVTFELSLPADSRVRLDIYSMTGQIMSRVYDGSLPGGENTLKLDKQLPGGVYLYRFQSGGTIKTGKLIINNISTY